MACLRGNAGIKGCDLDHRRAFAMGGYSVREVGLHDYCTGLLLDVARKSVEPMAAQCAGTGERRINHCYTLLAVRGAASLGQFVRNPAQNGIA